MLSSLFDTFTFATLLGQMKKITFQREVRVGIYSRERAQLNEQQRKQIEVPLQQALSLLLEKKSIHFTLFRYGWRDYSVLHDSIPAPARVEWRFILTPGWKREWGGGVFSPHGSGICTFFPVTENTLILKRYGKNERNYVRYITSAAGRRKMLMVEGVVR